MYDKLYVLPNEYILPTKQHDEYLLVYLYFIKMIYLKI